VAAVDDPPKITFRFTVMSGISGRESWVVLLNPFVALWVRLALPETVKVLLRLWLTG
jgi:hypothetical protein